jgi:uroporphyrinogen-III synthase
VPVRKPARVLVTRAQEDAQLLSFFLSRAELEPVVVPTIARKWRVPELAQAIREASPLDWIVLTSSTAVNVLGAASPHPDAGTKLAAVGSTTARRAEELGLPIDLMPAVFTREELIRTMGSVEGQRILYPRADMAPSTVCDSLRAAGAQVTDVIAYTNTAPEGYAEELLMALPVSVTTLFSGSAARRVAAAIPAEQRAQLGVIAAVGPSTAKAARAAGLEVGAVATPHTLAGVVELVRKIIGKQSGEVPPQ